MGKVSEFPLIFTRYGTPQGSQNSKEVQIIVTVVVVIGTRWRKSLNISQEIRKVCCRGKAFAEASKREYDRVRASRRTNHSSLVTVVSRREKKETTCEKLDKLKEKERKDKSYYFSRE